MSGPKILHENPQGTAYVIEISKLFHVMVNGATHATGEATAYKDVSLAIARCNYIGKFPPMSATLSPA